jgi:radical SAM-linked protein
MVRLWERVYRRSGLPILYTEGYRARPRLSFGPSKSVGIASNAEYLDIRMLETPEEIITRKLSQKVPEGIEIQSVAILNPNIESLDSTIDRWEYIIEFDRPMESVNDRCHELLQKDRIEVTRHRKKHKKANQHVDIRPSIAELNAIDREIHLTITKPGPLVTIPEILALLDIDHTPIQITRTGQWISLDNQIIDPIEVKTIAQPNWQQTVVKK